MKVGILWGLVFCLTGHFTALYASSSSSMVRDNDSLAERRGERPILQSNTLSYLSAIPVSGARFQGGYAGGSAESELISYTPMPELLRLMKGGNGDGFGESELPPYIPIPELARLMKGGSGDGFGESEMLPYSPMPELSRLMKGGIGDGFSESELKVFIPRPELIRFVKGGPNDGFTESDLIIRPPLPADTPRLVKGGSNDGFSESENIIRPPEEPRLWAGGKDDGFSESCTPPKIVENQSMAMNCENDSAVFVVKVRGSDLKYRWEKYVEEDFEFREFVPARTGVKVKNGALRFMDLSNEDDGFYRCVISNECGEAVSDTFALSVGGVPLLKTRLNKDWDQCLYGAPVQMAVYATTVNDKPLTYTWTKDGKILSGEMYSGSGITVEMNDKSAEGMYKVVVSNACGEVADSTYLPVNTPAYVAKCDSVLHVCDGSSAEFKMEAGGGGAYESALYRVRLSSTNPLGYEMTERIGEGLKVSLPEVRYPEDDGQYFVWVLENRCGGDTSRLIRLVVEQLPEVQRIEGDTLLCAGERLELKVITPDGVTGNRYHWYKDGENLVTKTSASYVKNGVTKADAGNYYCYVKTAYCEAPQPSNIVKVVVGEQASITVRDIFVRSDVVNSENKYCEGVNLSLNVILSDAAHTDSIRWYRGASGVEGVPGRITGERSVSLQIDSLTIADAGVYHVGVINGCGENIVGSLNLQVMQYAHFADSLTNLVLCQGANQALSVKAYGTAPIRYTWTHNGAIVADGYSSTVQLTNVTVDTGGVYCCEIHNWCNLPERACAEIQVTRPDTFRLTGEGSYCLNSSGGATLTLAGSNVYSLYRLYRNGVVVSYVHGKDVIPEGGSIVFADQPAGVYYVTQEDDSTHCEARMPGTVEIKGNAAPRIYTLGLVESYCEGTAGGQLRLSGSEKNDNITYTLYRIDEKTEELIPPVKTGSGESLLWIDIPEGDYKVVAENLISGCRSVMSGVVNVSCRKAPRSVWLTVKDGDSVYCAGTVSSVTIEQDTLENGVSYALWKSHMPTGITGVVRGPANKISYERLEEGIYTVVGSNIWGCRSEESNAVRVLKRTLPQVIVSGADVYCKGDTSLRRIIIDSLRADLNYTVYRESPLEVYATLSGVNDRITLQVPSKEQDYYVVGEEKSDKKCRTVSEKVSIRESKFRIKAIEDQIIANGESAILSVEIVDGGEHPVIRWSPADRLEGRSDISAVRTIGLQSGVVFEVSVTTEGGCRLTDKVSVSVKGDVLSAEIREVDMVTPVDTVWLCTGDLLNLYGWADGGTGEYSVNWYEGDKPIGSTRMLTDYRPKENGYICYQVKSGEITVRDSVYVGLYPVAERLVLSDTALQCVYEDSYHFQLSALEAGVHYVLQYDRFGTGNYRNLEDTRFVGDRNTSGYINRTGILDSTGYYRVTIYKENERGGCWVYSPEVEIRKSPYPYRLTGNDVYCTGEKLKDTVVLENSETGVAYELIRCPGTTVHTALWGTDGNALLFAGNYGSGRYVVKAKEEKCEVILPDTINIERKEAARDLKIYGAGEYCTEDAVLPVNLKILHTVSDEVYTLYRNLSGAVTEVEEKRGGGTVAFGPLTEAGEYYVEVWKDNGCRKILSNRTFIGEPAGSFHLQGGNTYILGEEIPETKVKLYPAQPGISYDLYTVEGTYSGHFGAFYKDTLYFTGTLPEGSYVAKGGAGSCEGVSEDTVRIQIRLRKFFITGDTSFCDVTDNSGVVIGLDSTQNGVEYILQRANGENFEDLTPTVAFTGNGYPKNFAGLFKAGTYRVIGKWRSETEVMNGLLKVTPKLAPDTATLIFADGNFCSDSVVHIRIRTEDGAVYELYHNDTLSRFPLLYGNGDEQEWILNPAEERSYTVKAALGECQLFFPKSFQVGRLPEVDSLRGDTMLCSNVKGNLYLQHYDAAALYTLYTAAGEAVGTGDVVEGRYVYRGVDPGTTYYVEGAMGDCKKRSNTYRIDSIPATRIPAGFRMEWSNCWSEGEEKYIRLTGTSGSQNYFLSGSGLADTVRVSGLAGDIKLKVPVLGEYCVWAEESGTVCPSDKQCVELKEAAPLDTLTGNFTYCPSDTSGVELRLSGITQGAVYEMYRLADTVMTERLAEGAFVFAKRYKAGKYVLKKQRMLPFEGCVAYDTVEIKSGLELQNDAGLYVEEGSKLCPGEEIRIGIKQSQEGVIYRLKHTATGELSHMLAGTGGEISFGPVEGQAGYYRVYAEYAGGGCGVYMDSLIVVKATPRDITLNSCKECLSPGEVAKGCGITAKGMAYGVRYVLYDSYGTAKDTLYGGGAGTASFKPHAAGEYYVIAEDTLNGCEARMRTRPQIGTLPDPFVYRVNYSCGMAPQSVVTSGSDREDVVYVLYRYAMRLPADTLRGTGLPVDFGPCYLPGVYQVKAESANGCDVWLEDSVVIYNKPDTCELYLEGNYCEEGEKGLSLHLDCGVVGWNYYLMGEAGYSDTLSGDAVLSWRKVGGKAIKAGEYGVYAYNSCTTVFIDTIRVEGELYPAAQTILGDSVYCENRGFDIVLSGSEPDAVYEVVMVTSGRENVLDSVWGTGDVLPLNKEPYLSKGCYRVYAHYTGSTCRVKIAEKNFWPVELPPEGNLAGKDVCMSEGVDSIVLQVESRPAGVAYYLYHLGADTTVVDSLTSVYQPSPQLRFGVQHQEGCYMAYARQEVTGCRRPLNNVYCMGRAPAVYSLVKETDTLRICQGQDTCIYLAETEIGVKYYLLRDGNEVSGPVVGDGKGKKKIGTAALTGTYRVKADNGCEQLMEGQIFVNVQNLPVLAAGQSAYHYCEGNEGVLITIGVTTHKKTVYTLYDTLNRALEELKGNGKELSFTRYQTEAGKYKITARDSLTGCRSEVWTRVIVDTLPSAYSLSGVSGNYICWNGSVDIQLSGSSVGVLYTLYNAADKALKSKSGTGDPLLFEKITEPGVYRVKAGMMDGSQCEQFMLHPLTLLQADSLRRFQVTGEVTSYCYLSDSRGEIKLSASVPGVEYELYKDGIPTGEKAAGDGGELYWKDVEGKPCENCLNDNDGYQYHVVAQDTLTGCTMPMRGITKVIQENDVRMLYFHPNKDIYVCEDSVVDFTVSATGCHLKYDWLQEREGRVYELNGGPVKEPYYQIDRVKTTDYGKYRCNVYNTCSSISTSEVEVKVRQRMKENPDRNVWICDGVVQDVRLEAVYYATSYRWYKAGNPEKALGHEQVLVLPAATEKMSGAYVCEASNACYTLVDTCHLVIGKPPVYEVIKAQTDTLCQGEAYEMIVETADSIEWYLNGRFTGHTGNTYSIAAVDTMDEGHYSVRIIACGEVWVDLCNLYVDQPIQVLDMTNDSLIVCSDRMLNLFIETSPSERVTYRWEYLDKTIGHTSRLDYGPLSASNTFYTFRVWYRNKCVLEDPAEPIKANNYRQFRIKVNDKAEVKDPVGEIIACADSSRDTILRIAHTEAIGMSYSWHFYDYAHDTVPNVSYADTIVIALQTQNSGYYFCRVNNGCEVVATNACWVRIDTVPVLRSHLPATDTVCEGDKYETVLTATGGSLNYDWIIRYKNGETEILDSSLKTDFESSGKLVIYPVVAAHDSALIWCRIHNECGEAVSDTLMLSVNRWREVDVLPDTVSICGTGTGQIQVRLLRGDLPWNYAYRTPEGEFVWRKEIASFEDTLHLSVAGVYELMELRDAAGCRRIHDLPGFVLQKYEKPELSFGSSQALCSMDTVELKFHVDKGTGPWNIEIVDRITGELPEEICGTDGLLMSSADTVVRFEAVESAEYLAYRIVDVNNGCEGILQDSSVNITVHSPDYIQFAGGAKYVGQCAHVRLKEDVLKPYLLSGKVLPFEKLHFYVDEVDKGTSGIWLKEELESGSCYDVRCEYTDSMGCRVISDEVKVCVDGLPSGEIVSSDVACESVASEFALKLQPAGRIDSVVIRQVRYKKWDAVTNPTVKPRYMNLMYGKSLIPSDGLLRIPLNWDEVGGIDSCMTFEVLDIRDKFGCRMEESMPVRVYDSLYRDTVFRHWDPVVEVELRISEGESWRTGIHEVNLSAGDSVQVKVALKKGQPLWELDGLGIGPISGMDTVFWLKNEGSYVFIPRDLSCDRQGPAPWYDLKITYLDTGYFRGRLLLEGPYDSDNGRMGWGICETERLQNSLKLPVSLPLLPAGLEVIDWVEVELRISNGYPVDSVALMTDSSCVVTRDSCLVLSDGHLADRWSGDTLVGIRNAYGSGANKRYVVVCHRNHLGIMTKELYVFVNRSNREKAAVVDFTDAATVYCRDGELQRHMTRKVRAGKTIWLLSAGELNMNRLITLYDPNRIALQKLRPDDLKGDLYDLLYDINLDGCVDWPGWNGKGENAADWNIIKRNRQKYMEIKWIGQ